MNKFARIFAKTANIWRGLVAVFLLLTIVACFMTQLAFDNKITINSVLGLTIQGPRRRVTRSPSIRTRANSPKT